MLGGILVILLIGLSLFPEPRSVRSFRIAAYTTQVVWFSLMMIYVASVASYWHHARHIIATAILATFSVAMISNVLSFSVAADIAKITFGALAGAAFIRAVERPWWLLPISICVPLADAWSVFSSRGVTHAVIERSAQEPRWIQWPTIATPIAGLPYEQFGRLGTVDVLFAALFLAAGWRWQLGVMRIGAALMLALVSSIIIAFESTGLAIPALPLLCLGFLLVTGRRLWRDMQTGLGRE